MIRLENISNTQTLINWGFKEKHIAYFVTTVALAALALITYVASKICRSWKKLPKPDAPSPITSAVTARDCSIKLKFTSDDYCQTFQDKFCDLLSKQGVVINENSHTIVEVTFSVVHGRVVWKATLETARNRQRKTIQEIESMNKNLQNNREQFKTGPTFLVFYQHAFSGGDLAAFHPLTDNNGIPHFIPASEDEDTPFACTTTDKKIIHIIGNLGIFTLTQELEGAEKVAENLAHMIKKHFFPKEG